MEPPSDVSLFALSLPLREPFTTATGQVSHREVVLVRVGDDIVGWGEAAPYPGQDEPLEELLARAQIGEASPTLAAALDEATSDRAARAEGRSLTHANRSRVPISMAVGIDGAVARVDALVADGVRSFKVKVAPGRIDHLAGIRDRHPDITLGIDGNRSFPGLDELIPILGRVEVAYAEELLVVATAAELEVLSDLGVPHFADESVRSIEDAVEVVRSRAYSGVTLKPGRLGWVGACAVRDLAREVGMRWRASGLLETGLGRAFTDRLAAEPDADRSDVAPASWFLAADVVDRPVDDGHVIVPTGVGLGVAPDVDRVERHLMGQYAVRITRSA